MGPVTAREGSPRRSLRHQMGPMGVPPSPDVVLTANDGTQVHVPSALFRTSCSPAGATLAAAMPKPPLQHIFLFELELELIQSHMAQKLVLRGEVGCACVVREVRFDSGWTGVSLAVALGKGNVACVVHIKSSFVGFP